MHVLVFSFLFGCRELSYFVICLWLGCQELSRGLYSYTVRVNGVRFDVVIETTDKCDIRDI